MVKGACSILVKGMERISFKIMGLIKERVQTISILKRALKLSGFEPFSNLESQKQTTVDTMPTYYSTQKHMGVTTQQFIAMEKVLENQRYR